VTDSLFKSTDTQAIAFDVRTSSSGAIQGPARELAAEKTVIPKRITTLNFDITDLGKSL
jgi:hypothetical protein